MPSYWGFWLQNIAEVKPATCIAAVLDMNCSGFMEQERSEYAAMRMLTGSLNFTKRANHESHYSIDLKERHISHVQIKF